MTQRTPSLLDLLVAQIEKKRTTTQTATTSPITYGRSSSPSVWENAALFRPTLPTIEGAIYTPTETVASRKRSELTMPEFAPDPEIMKGPMSISDIAEYTGKYIEGMADEGKPKQTGRSFSEEERLIAEYRSIEAEAFWNQANAATTGAQTPPTTPPPPPPKPIDPAEQYRQQLRMQSEVELEAKLSEIEAIATKAREHGIELTSEDYRQLLGLSSGGVGGSFMSSQAGMERQHEMNLEVERMRIDEALRNLKSSITSKGIDTQTQAALEAMKTGANLYPSAGLIPGQQYILGTEPGGVRERIAAMQGWQAQPVEARGWTPDYNSAQRLAEERYGALTRSMMQ